jgi:chemotaxis protein MotB
MFQNLNRFQAHFVRHLVYRKWFLLLNNQKVPTVISLNFSPNPTPAVTETLRQQTTELQKPELELQTKLEDSPEGGEADKKKDSDFDGAGGESDASLDATELAKQLKEAIDSGEVQIETLGENVVINFPKEELDPEEIKSTIQETMNALAEARQAAGASESEVPIWWFRGRTPGISSIS